MISLFNAFLFRDFLIEKKYKLHFAMKLLGILFQVSLFYFLSKMVTGFDYFPYVLCGLMFARFFEFFLGVFSDSIRHEQYWGTSDMIFSVPKDELAVLVVQSLPKALSVLVEMVFYIIFAKMFYGFEIYTNVFKLFPLIAINAVSFASIGIISASFIMYFKKGDPVNWIVSLSVEFLSGVYFPLKLLPDFLQKISNLILTSSALNLWRGVLLENKSLTFGDYMPQIFWAVCLSFISVFTFKKFLYLSKKSGDLGNY